MAWSFGDSFDLYAAPADMVNGYWDSGSVASVNFFAGRFAGSQSAQFGTANNLVRSSGVNDAVHHFVVSFQQTTTITGSTLGQYIQLLDGATAQCSVVFRSDGAILLASGGPTGTVLATYAGAFPVINTWYAFEIEIVINNATGSISIRKNGNPVNDFTLGSLNTRPTSTNNYANKLQIGNQAGSAHRIDDLFWRSDASSVAWLGDIRCYARMPASDASVTFSRSSASVTQQNYTGGQSTATLISNATAVYGAMISVYDGTINSVTIATSGGSGNMKCAIFANNAGNVGAVIQAATAPVTVAGGNLVFAFSPPVPVVRNATYWIGACCDTSGTGNWVNSASANALGQFATASYATFPQSNPVVSANQRQLVAIWALAGSVNYGLVAESQQDGLTSYVYDSTPGDADFYGVGSIASTPASVIATTVRAYAQKSDAGTRTMAVQLKSGATTVASPTLVLTTSGFQWAWRMDLTDPATGAAWTAAAVNNAQIGPRVVA